MLNLLLSLFYFLVIVPTGFFVKLFRMDLLGQRKKDSYWTETEISTNNKDSMLGF